MEWYDYRRYDMKDEDDATHGHVGYCLSWWGEAPDDCYYEIREYMHRCKIDDGKKKAQYCIVTADTEGNAQYIWCQSQFSATNKLAKILEKKYKGTDWPTGWGHMPMPE